MRDDLIDAYRKHDENADFMTREQVGMMVDFTLEIFDLAGYTVISKELHGQLVNDLKQKEGLRYDRESDSWTAS